MADVFAIPAEPGYRLLFVVAYGDELKFDDAPIVGWRFSGSGRAEPVIPHPVIKPDVTAIVYPGGQVLDPVLGARWSNEEDWRNDRRKKHKRWGHLKVVKGEK